MQNDYLTTKNPFYALFVFTLPMIVGNIFQQTYVMADSAILGRFVSQKALAAVGASYSLTNIFICVAIGGGIGASVLVSRNFGAKDFGKLRTAVNTALLSFLGISIVLGAAGLLVSKPMMMALDTPSSVLDMSIEYLNIYFAGLPFLFMYNVLSAMFNALGKSKIPLWFLIFSSLFNIALDWILVTRFGMGIAGVAWATLIAQCISAVLSFIVLQRMLRGMSGEKSSLFDPAEFATMSRIALPSILQQSTVSIGMMLVQSVVNSFGDEVLAGFSAAMRIESLCVVPMAAICNAVSSYTAQNIGASRKDRVVSGMKAANIQVALWAALIMILLETLHNPIMRMFLGDGGTAPAMATGNGYLVFMGFFFGVIGFKMVVDGVLRGAGDMKAFTIANLVNLALRVMISKLFAPRYGVALVWYSVPIGWAVNWIISFAEYRTGKWKRITGE